MKKFHRIWLASLGTMLLPMLTLAGPVNVNSANAETISAELKGVGLSKAQAIVEWRNSNGPFKSADDLTLVKGIGERTVEINRANIMLDGGSGKARK